MITTNNGLVVIDLPTEEKQSVRVDFVHDANEMDDSIYHSSKLKGLLGKFMEGYNVAILTYGQTGSGKTFAL